MGFRSPSIRSTTTCLHSIPLSLPSPSLDRIRRADTLTADPLALITAMQLLEVRLETLDIRKSCVTCVLSSIFPSSASSSPKSIRHLKYEKLVNRNQYILVHRLGRVFFTTLSFTPVTIQRFDFLQLRVIFGLEWHDLSPSFDNLSKYIFRDFLPSSSMDSG